MKTKIIEVIFRDWTKMTKEEKALSIKSLLFIALAVITVGLGEQLSVQVLGIVMCVVFMTIGVIYQMKRLTATRSAIVEPKTDKYRLKCIKCGKEFESSLLCRRCDCCFDKSLLDSVIKPIILIERKWNETKEVWEEIK